MDDTTRPTLQMLNPEMDEKFSLYINEISRDSWDHSLKAASLLAVSTTVFLITNLVFQRRSESFPQPGRFCVSTIAAPKKGLLKSLIAGV